MMEVKEEGGGCVLITGKRRPDTSLEDWSVRISPDGSVTILNGQYIALNHCEDVRLSDTKDITAIGCLRLKVHNCLDVDVRDSARATVTP